ncbi:MAG: hypothetical protein HYS20_15660, partial [Rhodocyclales bacterium]|nr:hypothetical protein [Rhodocyclales bacterium]
VLIPALVIFVGITIYAWRRQRADAACGGVGVHQNPDRGE